MGIGVPVAREQDRLSGSKANAFRVAQIAAALLFLAFLTFAWYSYHGRIQDPSLNAYAPVGFQLVAYFLAAATAASASAISRGRTRWAWALLSASSACAALGIVVLVFFQAVPQDAFTFYLFLLVNGIGLTGLVLLLPSQEHYERQLIPILDSLVVAGSLFCLFWMLVFGPLYEVSQASYYSRLTTILYPSLTVVVLTLIVSVFARTPHAVRAPLRYILAAWCTAAVALPVYTYFALEGKTWAAYIGVGGVLATLLLDALAALRVPTMVGSEVPAPIKASRASHYVVYVPVATVVPVAIWHYITTGVLEAAVFAVGISVFVFLFARLVLSQRETERINQLLRESAEFKTQMLRFISHEIANPLTPLMMQGAMMKRAQEQGPVDEATQRNFAVFARSLNRLDSLSKDVRSIAQLDAGKMPLDMQEHDLVAETQKAVDASRGLAEQRQIQLKFLAPKSPALARIDAERFGQVVDNLLSNALKFTQANGTIDVAVVEDAPGWTLIVQDTGAGLSSEQRNRLFTAFGRAHGNQAPGLGLGLVICKGIVEAHGGTITVESQGPKRGTQFRVHWPNIPAPATPPMAAPA
jgi:signal transduction histidine kinase